MKIVFSAAMSMPPGAPGSIRHRLHYLLGLRDLGHDVYFVEETYRDACVDASGAVVPFEKSENVRLFSRIMGSFGLIDHASLLYEGGREAAGLSLEQVTEIARDADLVINMSGHLSPGPILDAPRCRVYLDEDPVYTQLWCAEYGQDLNFDRHDVFVTVGLNIGTERSPIPDCSIDWIYTLPPVVLPIDWTPSELSRGSYTTVVSWDVFGDVAYRGEWYGSRREELVRFAALPSMVDAPFEMMVKNFEHADDGMRSTLLEGGWQLADARAITDLDDYRRYIRSSRGEIGIAKNAYVKGNSGWFSERSAEYLAAGRPVIAQSTGFETALPTGRGLMSFRSLEEAAQAVSEVESDLERHARAAREVAEMHLSHRRVLPQLLEGVEARSR